MSTKCLIVPNTGQKLYDGDVVMLSRYPGMKWILHCGWYTYYNGNYQGWYFQSIPTNTVIPVVDDDLTLLTVVSTNSSSCGCDCNSQSGSSGSNCAPPQPSPSIPPSNPSGPGGPGLSPENAYELDRAWISVETVAKRDQLNKRLLPDGKVVRVNQTSEGPKYFIWNQVTENWDDFNIETSGNSLSKEDADKLYATKTIEETVDKQSDSITVIERAQEWQELPDVE